MAPRKDRKRKKRAHKKSAGTTAPVSLPDWYESELSDWSTGDILGRLQKHGLSMDEATFRLDAEDLDDPSEMADKWIERVGRSPGRWQDFFEFAVRRLWERFLPERDTFDSLIEDITRHLDELDDREASEWSQEDVDGIMHFLDRIETLLQAVERREGADPKERLDTVAERQGFDLVFWLFQLPMDLAGEGYVDQAVEVAHRFAFVDPGNMLGDLGQILASHGRCGEALAQVEQNLSRFSEDLWVIIKAGDVHDQCGQPEKAIELYEEALEKAEDRYDKEGVYERLIPLYEILGKDEEAERIKRMEEQDRETALPLPPSSASPRKEKIGRNDPCPCGSGRKYKKCCLNKA
jgi:tetratricopeptide (TPR) repeat protein